MSDSRWLRRMLGFGLLGVVGMTVLVPTVALLRGTTGHDWYAASKLTAIEIALAVGFDPHAPVVEYRTRKGAVERTSRYRFYFEGEALWARERILVTARDHALVGAGVSLGVVLLMLLGGAALLRRGGSGVAVVAPAARGLWAPDRAGGNAGLSRPGFGGARIGLLVVSPAEVERLVALHGHSGRPGYIDLPGPDGMERIEPGGGLLERADAPALLPAGRGCRGVEAAVTAKPAPAGKRKQSRAKPATANPAGAQPSGTGNPAPANPEGSPGKADVRKSGRGQNFY